ncbi:MAG: DUF2357 domain-containing protein [Clostridia bacterium]|nr:DUF2357 domain-containing protein [Clostridia bacterium]
MDLDQGAVSVPFFGSPVLSVVDHAEVFLDRGYEKFLPFGPAYRSSFGPCQLYQVPHGVITEKNGKMELSGEGAGRMIVASSPNSTRELRLQTEGAVSSIVQCDGENKESQLYRTILSWSNYFDECIQESSDTNHNNRLPWSDILESLKRIAAKNSEPRMALIVRIAERLHNHLPRAVHAARRILVRERNMTPAPRVSETDTACLRWYVRQPGTTSAQKAAANNHRLLAVTRRESLETLENMVLKDFLARCRKECRRYLNFDCTDQQRTQSERGRSVNLFGHMCETLKSLPQLQSISRPPVVIRPNYVLQNDHRYKHIWELYLKLLRREETEDRLWDWQARTWADIGRMLVNVALISLEGKNEGQRFELKEILKSALVILPEQRLGSRIERGCEPGPFEIRSPHGCEAGAILEIVHPALAGEHPVTKNFGRLGGHLYLVFTPLNGKQQTVVVLWAVHTAGGDPKIRPTWNNIVKSASSALKRHQVILEERATNLPLLRAFVLANDLEAKAPEIYSASEGSVHLVRIPTNQECWGAAVENIARVLKEALEVVI